ncbi:hypothetical protein H0A36_30310, partial [Endozoicomonas sp. SM1973]
EMRLYIDGKYNSNYHWYSYHEYNAQYAIPLEPGKHTIEFRAAQTDAGGYLELDNLILPALVDSDNDQVRDGWEYEFFSKLDQDFQVKETDTDSDGLTDLEEHTHDTNPTKADTDGDTLSDQWEVRYQLSPLKYDVITDTDKDGVRDLEEWIAQTDPTDPNDKRRLLIDFEDDQLGGYYWHHSGAGTWEITAATNGDGQVWRPVMAQGQDAFVKTHINVPVKSMLYFKAIKTKG